MNLALQAERRQQLIGKFCRHAMEYFSLDGTFHGPYTTPDERDWFWIASMLLDHGGAAEQGLAETLLRNSFGGPDGDYTKLSLEENIVDIQRAEVRDWNIFQSNIGTVMLARHGNRLPEDLQAKLGRLARRNCSRYAGSAQADYFFHGANDNMPAHATSGLILAGQYIGDAQAIKDGMYRLHMFKELLSRRGLCSEFSSGTYSALTIGAMADLVELAEDPAVREIALQIEQQLWADIVCHYHPGSGKNAGPQTRAYTVNTIEHLDSIMLLLWTVTGEPAFIDPMRDIITVQPKQVVHGDGDAFKTAVEHIHGMTPTFHFPEHLAPLLEAREYPFRFYGSAEHMYGGNPDVGGRAAFSTVYQTADYALATSDHGFMSGNQSERIRIAYRRVAEPQSFHDTGVLHARYLYNDEVPGTLAHLENCAPGEKGLLYERSLARTLQHDNIALVVSRGQNHSVPAPAPFHRLRQTVILPAHYHDIEDAYIGETRVDDFTGAAADYQPVFLNLGRMYLALFPLAMTDHGRTDLIRLEKVGNYRMISFFNYEGPAREFDAATLQETFNGFIAQVSGPEEAGSFDAFRANWSLDLVEDYWLANNRRTRVVFHGTELLLNWSALSDTVRAETINGQAPRHERLWATGLDIAQFPLLTGPYTPMPVLHYDNLEIAWYPELHWQIGVRMTKLPDKVK
ncbi:MAG: hypothetical protein ACYDBB_17435 [Armatimonadota bacterium]